MTHPATVFFVGGTPAGRPVEHVPGAVTQPGELLSRAGLSGYFSRSSVIEPVDQDAFNGSQMLVYCVSMDAIMAHRPVADIVNEADAFCQKHGNIVVFVPAEQLERNPYHTSYVNELLAVLRALGAGRGFVVREHVDCFWTYLTTRMPRQRRGVPVAT